MTGISDGSKSIPTGPGKDGFSVRVDGTPAFIVKPGNLPTWHDFLDGKFPESFADWDFPEIPEIKFADFTAELDKPLGNRRVLEMGIGASIDRLGEPQGTTVRGRTLREIIQRRANEPLVGPLIVAYQVGSPAARDEKSYFINGEIVTTPEEADRMMNSRLSMLLRLTTFSGTPGIAVPLLGSHGSGVPFMHSFRIVPVSIMGRKIGPAIGLDPTSRVLH